MIEGFTRTYNVHKLVYYEIAEEIEAAILREKQIKGGSRQKKNNLVTGFNPEWKDLWDELQKDCFAATSAYLTGSSQRHWGARCARKKVR